LFFLFFTISFWGLPPVAGVTSPPPPPVTPPLLAYLGVSWQELFDRLRESASHPTTDRWIRSPPETGWTSYNPRRWVYILVVACDTRGLRWGYSCSRPPHGNLHCVQLDKLSNRLLIPIWIPNIRHQLCQVYDSLCATCALCISLSYVRGGGGGGMRSSPRRRHY